MARLPQVAAVPLFHAWLVAASNTVWGGMRLKHCSSRSWTAVMAFCSSARHFSADQRSPTTIGVLVM